MSWTATGKSFMPALGLALAVLASNANAAMLVSETFSYADGGLVGKDPPAGGAWSAFSGVGATPILVTSGTVAVQQGAGSREDDSVPFEGGFTAVAGTVLYSGFDLTVADPAVTPLVDVYFATFLAGTSSFDARVWITAPTTSGYRLAISNDNSITDADGEVRTGDLAFGTTYRVVTKYDFTAKTGTLWINPVDESSASFAATDPGFSDAITAYALRQATGNTTQVLDNLYVSTTFVGAQTGVEVPEPVSFGLLTIAGLTIATFRRRTT
jgi:hypothetical protein